MDVYKDQAGGVTLSDKEHEITDLFLMLVLEEEMEIEEAAGHALCALPNPDPLFVHWLSQGSIVPKPRSGN
jgi:hypothetical protein